MSDITSKEFGVRVKDPCGRTRITKSIVSNRDHVGNLIAEGYLNESERLDAVISLYEAQRKIDEKTILTLQERINKQDV
jgi:hypothetical protein